MRLWHKWQGIIYKLIILLRVGAVFQKMAVLLHASVDNLYMIGKGCSSQYW